MKIGDLVRRGRTYKPEWREELAMVIDMREGPVGGINYEPRVRLLWSNGNYDPELKMRGVYAPQIWYPCGLLEVVQE